LPIRWRLTLFNALTIGAIMAVSGLVLFFSLRAVLLSGVERTVRESALAAAHPKDELGELTSTINALLGRLEEAFARREEAVLRLEEEEALGRERRSVADASHELRTPLTNIEGYAEMLDDWAANDPEMARQSIEAIREESGRMQRLVEELLSLARGDEGPALELAPQDLSAVTEEAMRIARVAAGDKVSLDYVSPEHAITATFDRNRIRQVLSILLDNAIKYTPQGGKATVRLRQFDGQVEVAVSDTGIGISEEDLPRVFERFYRADKARARGGAGLGLAIARQIADAHGGTMEVRSKEDEGSTFVLRIPQNRPER
jgi:signal transduction histidine kinase